MTSRVNALPNSQMSNRKHKRSFSNEAQIHRMCETRSATRHLFSDIMKDFNKSKVGAIPNLALKAHPRQSQSALNVDDPHIPSVLSMPNLKVTKSRQHVFGYNQEGKVKSEYQSINLKSQQSLNKINSMTKAYKDNS